MEKRAGCFTLIVFWCLVAIFVLWFFLAVPWVGMQCVIVVFPDHTHLRFFITHRDSYEGINDQFSMIMEFSNRR